MMITIEIDRNSLCALMASVSKPKLNRDGVWWWPLCRTADRTDARFAAVRRSEPSAANTEHWRYFLNIWHSRMVRCNRILHAFSVYAYFRLYICNAYGCSPFVIRFHFKIDECFYFVCLSMVFFYYKFVSSSKSMLFVGGEFQCINGAMRMLFLMFDEFRRTNHNLGRREFGHFLIPLERVSHITHLNERNCIQTT